MIGIDTSFLIASELQDHVDYQKVHAILNALEESETFALTPQVVSEFLHAVTDGRRLKNPLTMRDALRRAEIWLGASDVTLLYPDAQSLDLFLGWMVKHRLGRKRILDTLLAATLAAAGVVQLATINISDFKVFGVFDFIAPP